MHNQVQKNDRWSVKSGYSVESSQRQLYMTCLSNHHGNMPSAHGAWHNVDGGHFDRQAHACMLEWLQNDTREA